MADVVLRIETSDPDFVARFFSGTPPASGQRATALPGVEASFETIGTKRGMVETTTILQFVLSVASGVAMNVLSEWLKELVRKRTRRVEVSGLVTDPEQIDRVLAAALRGRDAR